jgi:hypothetical protein
MRPRLVVACGVVLSAALGGGGFAAYAFLRGPGPTKVAVPAPTVSEPDVAALETKVAQMEQAMGAMMSQRAAGEAVTPASREGGVDQRPARPIDPAARPADPTERDAWQKRYLADLAQKEPRDRAWATGEEEAIQSAVQASVAADAGTTVDSLGCKTSMCRLEVSNTTPAARSAFIKDFSLHFPPMSGARVEISNGSDGTAKTTVDFIRSGYPIPTPDEAL